MTQQCWSADGEMFNYETLGDLIANHDDIEVGCTVYVGDTVPANPHHYCEADDIIEMMGERAHDDCGEFAEDFPDVTDAQRDELNDLLKAWQTKYCQPTFWHVRNAKPYVLTAEDLASE